jgi:hypothetical protein
LDKYCEVFDLNDYRLHRSQYFGSILAGRKDDSYKQEIYEAIKRKGVRIPKGTYLYLFPDSVLDFIKTHFPDFLRYVVKHTPEFVKRRNRMFK